MKNLKIILTTIILIVFVSINTNAQKRGEKFPPKNREIFKEKLNLTEAQETTFNNIKIDHQQKVTDLHADIKKNRLEVKRMMTNNEVNEEKLLSLTEKNNELRSQIHSSKVTMWLDIYKILNDNQKGLWTEHFAKIGDGKFMGKHGRGGDRPHFGKHDFGMGRGKKHFNRPNWN